MGNPAVAGAEMRTNCNLVVLPLIYFTDVHSFTIATSKQLWNYTMNVQYWLKHAMFKKTLRRWLLMCQFLIFSITKLMQMFNLKLFCQNWARIKIKVKLGIKYKFLFLKFCRCCQTSQWLFHMFKVIAVYSVSWSVFPLMSLMVMNDVLMLKCSTLLPFCL